MAQRVSRFFPKQDHCSAAPGSFLLSARGGFILITYLPHASFEESALALTLKDLRTSLAGAGKVIQMILAISRLSERQEISAAALKTPTFSLWCHSDFPRLPALLDYREAIANELVRRGSAAKKTTPEAEYFLTSGPLSWDFSPLIWPSTSERLHRELLRRRDKGYGFEAAPEAAKIPTRKLNAVAIGLAIRADAQEQE